MSGISFLIAAMLVKRLKDIDKVIGKPKKAL